MKEVCGSDGPWVLQQDGEVFFLEYTGWPEVRCLFTARMGGVSPPPYDSLNLDFTVGDSPDMTEQNVRLMRRACRLNKQRIVRTSQVHSSSIGVVDSERSHYVGDGLITAMKGVWLAVSVADCLPIYIYDRDAHAVGIAHAGWRGTEKSVAASLIERMSETFGASPFGMSALFGPGIGPCCYEVSVELASRFERLFPGSSSGRHVDLLKANRMLLKDLGVHALSEDPPCTSCNPGYFFSHRRDSGITGRMLAMISISDSPSLPREFLDFRSRSSMQHQSLATTRSFPCKWESSAETQIMDFRFRGDDNWSLRSRI